MPQQGQIIPNWLHPHNMTIINDNTQFQDTAAPVPDGVRSLFVITSPKGRDGVVLDFTDATSLVGEYGKPNFRLYGQPHLNAYAFVSGGKSKAWVMRVMPDDAAYANSVVVAKVKVDKTVPATPKLMLHFEVVQHVGLLDKTDVEALTDLLTVTTPDADGYSTYPLYATYALGRGLYGNAFRYRFIPSAQADKENDYRNYRIEVLELENTLTRKEVFNGTVNPDALNGSTSLFLEDVMNDPDNGSKKVGVYVSAANFTALYNLYKTEVDPATEITEDQFSIITGTLKDGTAIPGITFETAITDAVALDNPEGIPLVGGTDGAFADGADGRDAAIDAAYISAFKGEIDPAVTSKRRTPCEVILDANYSDEVKRELITLLNKRYDAEGYIDGGILNTNTDAVAWGQTVQSLGDRIFSKQFQHYKIRDPFTGKIIPVTITFLFANKIAAHFKDKGNYVPFTGEENTLLTGAIKNSLKPQVDADDEDTKEILYNLRLNYYETVAENTYVRGTQTTSQNIWSDLSEENNMHVLLEMKREIENLVSKLSYNFSEADDRKRFTDSAARVFKKYIGTKVRTAGVRFEMNAWEEERSILHCYMDVTFRTMAKRSIVEIDINKRV